MVFISGIPIGPSSFVKISFTFNVTTFGKQVQFFFFTSIISKKIVYDSINFISVLLYILESIDENKNVVYFSSSGRLLYKNYLLAKGEELQSTSRIIFYREDSKNIIEAYVIALSVLTGGFLLLVIITWLAKRKFFRRSKKQELKALKDAEASFIYFATGSVFQN